MSNGLNIGWSNTGGQAAVIFKQPIQQSIYYIFTADTFGVSGGLKYSVVDMNGLNGLGAIIPKALFFKIHQLKIW